jgi:HD-GYP domain-containing protein (c-di-GMP phosphodiesterase class II)
VKALAYLEERAGIEFEPRVARAFVEMVRAWDERVATAESTLASEQDVT